MRHSARTTTNRELIERARGRDAPFRYRSPAGMRTLHHIESWFEAGAAQVVLGTLAITDQQLAGGSLCPLSGRRSLPTSLPRTAT